MASDGTPTTLSHGRLPWPAPGEMGPAQREVYDAIAGGPRAAGPKLFRMTDDDGRLEGPFNSMLAAPSVGMPLQELGAAIRYRTSLSARIREVAILAVAAHHRCDYEWYAHEAVGRGAGLTDDEMAALKAGRTPDSLDEQEKAVHRASLSLLASRRLDESAYADAASILRQDEIAELVVLIGYYETLQLMIGAFDAPLPSGVDSPFGTAGR